MHSDEWKEMMLMMTKMREDVAEIRTDQKHIFNYITDHSEKLEFIRDKSDRAADRAEDAFSLAERTEKTMYKHFKKEDNNRKFIVTTALTVIALLLSLIPILFRFYT